MKCLYGSEPNNAFNMNFDDFLSCLYGSELKSLSAKLTLNF